MIAIIPVRHGVLPLGALEACAESGGSAWLIGSGCNDAAHELKGVATKLRVSEVGTFQPGAWAVGLAGAVTESVILPASPDGRDLAPRLAAAMGVPLIAGCTEVRPGLATAARMGGRVLETTAFESVGVTTLLPGVRSVAVDPTIDLPEAEDVPLRLHDVPDALLVSELPPDPSTMDLAEAPRIIAGGAGLGDQDAFDSLAGVASLLGASMGGTRVVMDSGLVAFERQIGTTGVTVDPDLYSALGISGAVQHTAGLGQPDHIISVNTDPHCPMMAMSDLAIECDAAEFLDALAKRLR